MKKILFLLGCLPVLGANAQLDNQQAFSTKKDDKAVITAYLENCPNDSLVQLWEPYSGEYDSVRTKNNRFSFTMPMSKGGSVYIIKMGDDPNDQKGVMICYLENGKMNIVGKGMNLAEAKVSGDKWVKEWKEGFGLVDGMKGDGKLLAELEAKYHKANEVGDEDAANEYSRLGDSLQKIRKTNILNWISKNPNSGVCGYLITCFIQSPKEKDSLMATLGEHAVNSRIVQRYLHPGKIDESPLQMKFGNEEEGNAQFSAVAIGKAAPDFSVPDVNGKLITLADFKGKYLLLDFWASWCGPCKPQIPFLKAANEKFKDKNLVVLGVSLDSKKEAWTKAIEKHELNWLNASSLKGWAEPAAQAYGASAIPFNVLIGPDGKILAMGLYDDNIDKKLTELIK